MSPNRRGEIRPADRAEIHAAKAALDEADERYRTAVVDALKHGASRRELERITGLSAATITRWGHARGWPTEAQRKVWETRPWQPPTDGTPI